MRRYHGRDGYNGSVTILVAALVGLALTALATWCTTGSNARRAAGVMLGVAVLVPPWFVPEGLPLLRGVWALAAFTTTMRIVDLSRTNWPLRERAVHAMSTIDSRRLVKITPRVHVAALARALAWCVLAAAGFFALRVASSWIARWAAGAVIAYAGVSALYEGLALAYAATGFETPPLHLSPLVSRTVQELWGERWARPINEWLRDTLFRPLARRRRPLVGLVLAFVVSAAFHAYAVWVALGLVRGLAMAGWMFAYFVAQAAVMILERALRVTRWPAWAAHVWTVSWMLATAPLFVEPVVRVLFAQVR
jgi:hypothetical protein